MFGVLLTIVTVVLYVFMIAVDILISVDTALSLIAGGFLFALIAKKTAIIAV